MTNKIEFNFHNIVKVTLRQQEDEKWYITTKDMIHKTITESEKNLTSTDTDKILSFLTQLASDNINKRLQSADKMLVPQIVKIIYHYINSSLKKEITKIKKTRERAAHMTAKLQKGRTEKGNSVKQKS